MKIKIIVCYHKPFKFITNEVYLPIHVGRTLSKLKLPIQGDDTGDNISNLNNLYCELTGLYWAWKNIDADYIGLCHYRRFFTFENNKLKNLIHKGYVKIQNIKGVFSKYPSSYSHKDEIIVNNEHLLIDKAYNASGKIKKFLTKNPNTLIIALKPVDFGFTNNQMLFSSVGGKFHLEIVRKIIAEKYPNLLDLYEKELLSNKLHFANMSVCSKKIIDEYCTFLFTILQEHSRIVINENWFICLNEKALGRISGYIAEILTSTYISYIKKQYGNKSVKLLTLLRTQV